MSGYRNLFGLAAIVVMTGSASAADLAARPYTKAPAPVASWTGFYVFGGAGGGLWAADSNLVAVGPGTALTRDLRLGGSGWFATVGAGYDWQFGQWVAGVFADGQFGEIKGALTDTQFEGTEKLRSSYAAGVRLGYLIAPNVLSYVNAGYSGSEWSGTTLSNVAAPVDAFTTPSFRRDGWFVGGGVENSLNILGITAPGWFMKTEYRSTFYNRVSLPESFVLSGAPNGNAITFKPWTQTVTTSLVYRFNSTGTTSGAADVATRSYTKAPAAGWTGFYTFGGAGGGLWNADSNAVVAPGFPVANPLTRDVRLGGSGWFGTVGAGYDWQFNGTWVAGLFADGQFGDIRGSLANEFFAGHTEGTEKLRTSYAAGVRLGYLVAPNVLSYVNAGYSGSEWSGTTMTRLAPGPALAPAFLTTPSFRRDGWFVGGGVENSLNIFGVATPGWFMKTEYRSTFYERISLPENLPPGSFGPLFPFSGVTASFKPWVQTISTSLVYRFNSPVVAKY
ncbi:outer membrane protein [Bradyrhizobium liaoningense]|uniref:outer membrane protein n=1 Tax=Bradyrhizobium liaoningense TaxID=43992 RepID=UPI001BA8150A|nr:autotransporter domain-containing protein [Bradyrhizobium liaoningense]MBR0718906.1 autotransporter domain-containing protein [Bradyrhizobium liaoningense]